MPHPLLHLCLAAGIVLAGCAGTTPVAPRFALAPAGASLTVTVAPASYQTQYLPVWDWDVAEAALARPGGAEVTASGEVVVDPDTGKRSASLVFEGLSTGSGFTLTLRLLRKQGESATVVATSERANLSIAPGANTLELGPALGHTPPALAAEAPLVPHFVTSLPEGGMAARLNGPAGLALGPDGSLYVADSLNGSIRRVRRDASGQLVVTMLAGTGYPAFLDGAGPIARFNNPGGLAVGGDGAVFVADTSNKVVRRIAPDANGTVMVSTLRDAANKNISLDQPVAVVALADGVLVVAERYRLTKLTPVENGKYAATVLAGAAESGQVDGAGEAARFKRIVGMVTLADGTLLVADADAARLRKVSPGDAQVTTLAPALSGLTALVPHGENAVLVAVGDRLQLVTLGPEGAVAAPFGSARFSQVRGLAVDAEGAVLVADAGDHRIKRLVDNTVTSLVGDGEAGNMSGPAGENLALERSTSLTVEASGTVLVADAVGHKLVAIEQGAGGAVARVIAGSGQSGSTNGPAATARFNGPAGVAVGPDGAYYVTDVGNNSVRRVGAATDGMEVTTVVTGLQYPGGIAFGPDGTMYLTEAGHPAFAALGRHRVVRVKRTESGWGSPEGLAGGAMDFKDGTGAEARFNRPTALVVMPDGSLVVADAENHRLRKLVIDEAGAVTVSTLAGTGVAGKVAGPALNARFNRPSGVALLPDGSLVIADYWNHQIQRLSPDGNVSLLAGGPGDAFADGPALQALFSRPVAVAVGPDGAVYVADAHRHGVRRIAP